MGNRLIFLYLVLLRRGDYEEGRELPANDYALSGALLLAMALCFGGVAVVLNRQVVRRRVVVKRTLRTTARPFRPQTLTRFDLLLIGVFALTFAALASSKIYPALPTLSAYVIP